MNGVVNNVSVTSQANFLTIEDIIATGQAAVTMNSGALVEYDGGNFFNQFYDESLQAQPDIVEIINDMGVQEPIAIPGIITGQIVSLTSPYNIGTASSPFQTDATSGLAVDATATSPSSAAIDIDNVSGSSLTSVGVSTYDGSVTIPSAGGTLSFDNSDSVLSETGTAVVDFANTDDRRRLGRRRRCKRPSLRGQHRGRYRCRWHCRHGTNLDEPDDLGYDRRNHRTGTRTRST